MNARADELTAASTDLAVLRAMLTRASVVFREVPEDGLLFGMGSVLGVQDA